MTTTAKLNENSYISIGVAVLLILCSLWINSNIQKAVDRSVTNAKDIELIVNESQHSKELTKLQYEALKSAIEQVTNGINQMSVDRVTKGELRRFRNALAERNEGIKVPELEEIE